MQMIQGALDLWVWVLEKVYYLLTLDLSGFSPSAFNSMKMINGALQSIGYGMLIIFTLMEVVKTCSSLQEIQRPEYVFKTFMRMIVVKYIIGYGFELVLSIFGMIQGLVRTILTAGGLMDSSGIWTDLKVPAELTDGVANFLMDAFNIITKNLFNLLPALMIIVVYIVMLVLAVNLILTVYGRFFKMLMFLALSPIPLATFASRESASIGKNYVKSFMSAALEGGIIALAIIVFSSLITSPWLAFDMLGEGQALGGVFEWAGNQAARLAYCFNLIFNMLIFMGVVKASDKFVHKIVGL